MKPLIDYTFEVAGPFIATLLKHLPEMSTVQVDAHFRGRNEFCVIVTIGGLLYKRALDVAPWLMPDADIYTLATDITHEHWQSMLDI